MKRNFDSSVSREEQLQRVAADKQPGRKHQKRMGPGKKANKQSNAARNSAKLASGKAKLHREKVAAYFAGKLDKYPTE